MTGRPLIIDCDTGVDDTIALLAAFGSSDEIDLRAITSCNGNVAEMHVAQNNIDIIEYLGKDIPVARGAYLPLLANRNANAGAEVHGKTGLGTVTLPYATHTPYDARIASRVIYEEAVKFNGELELLVTGPMTNAALAILQYPELKHLLKHIYYMGGAVIGGNSTTTAEFNIWADPEAAHVVMSSGIPQTMVGLDVTNLTVMNREDIEELRAYNTKASNLAADLLEFMMNRRNPDILKARMHDPLAFASVIFPQCLKFTDYFGDTECMGSYTRGHTHIDTREKDGHERNIRVATEVDVPLFHDWLMERIKKA